MQGLMNALAPVDTAAARNRGTQNALAEMKARGTARGMNRNEAIRQTGQEAAQGGYSTEEHANALRRMGHTDAANKLVQQGQESRGRELGNAAKGYEIVARTAPLARDQQSYDRIKQFWEEKGLAQAGELPDEFDPELVRTLAGKSREKLSASDLVEVQGPDGRPRFVPADMAAGMQPAQDQGDSTQTEREIQQYMQRGYSRPVAEDIAYGNIDVETDQFGNTYLVNKATGDRRVLRGEGGGQGGGQGGEQTPQPEGQPSEAQGTDLGEAVEEGTGPYSMGRAFINSVSSVIGPFMEGSPFPETARARSAVRNFNQTAKQALVNSERFPVYEQKIVQQLLPDPDRFFNNPDAEREKMDELRGFLQRKKDRIQSSMESGGVTTEERGNLSNQISTIDRVMGLMEPAEEGDQDAEFTMENPAQPTTREEYLQLPSGAYFRDDEGLKRKP